MSSVRANFARNFEHGRRREFAWRALILLALLATFALAWYAAEVLLLAFGAVLLAVFLSFLAERLAELIHVGRGWAFLIVAAVISVLLALAAWEVLPRVADQVSQLIRSLPQMFEKVRNYLQGREWGRTLLNYLPDLLASTSLPGHVSNIAQKLLEGLFGLAVIAVVGLYLGANPAPYHDGSLKLVAPAHRQRAREVLDEVGYTLRWWVIGQLIPMGVLGIASMIGLYLLRVPLAFTLGLFTGFMIFIPYIGSLIALAVTLAVAATQGGMTVLYVTLLFLGIHVAEGYLLTPLVQRRAVHLPPGLTIISQVLMGLLLGFLGLALATPLTAAGLVLVKMLYLHERPERHDAQEEAA